jgi:hypothetical protein
VLPTAVLAAWMPLALFGFYPGAVALAVAVAALVATAIERIDSPIRLLPPADLFLDDVSAPRDWRGRISRRVRGRREMGTGVPVPDEDHADRDERPAQFVRRLGCGEPLFQQRVAESRRAGLP